MIYDTRYIVIQDLQKKVYYLNLYCTSDCACVLELIYASDSLNFKQGETIA